MTEVKYLLIFVLGLPLLFALLFLMAGRHRVFGKTAALILPGVVCFLVFLLMQEVLAAKMSYWFSVEWFSIRRAGHDVVFSASLEVGRETVLMALVTSVTALLTFVFSIEYMKKSPGTGFYFAGMSFFLFAMYGFIFFSNILLIFLFWELLSFASYLLIGFDLEKNRSAAASLKAFLVNRIGDAGFLASLMLLWTAFGTLELSEIQALWRENQDPETSRLVFWAGVGLLVSVASKTAQFPFQTWLSDAMAAPTPVSALLHAATLVAAGIFLLIRVHSLLTPDVLAATAVLGAFGAVAAAGVAFYQKNMKRLLAWSTVSQLGLMLVAVGAGAPNAAFLHLIFHAFFKAGLFLCVGALVHALKKEAQTDAFHGDPENMDLLGGFRKHLPFVCIVQGICTLSLTGLPFFSGFFSKEAILAAVWSQVKASDTFFRPGIFAMLLVAVSLTALYAGKLYVSVFWGAPVLEKKPREGGFFIQFPLAVAAVLSLSFLWSLHPFSFESGQIFGFLPALPASENLPFYAALLPVAVGWGFVILLFKINKLRGIADLKASSFQNFMAQGFKFDELQRRLIVRPVLRLSEVLALFDQKILDGLVNVSAKVVVVQAHILSVFDKLLPDGIVVGLARTVGFVGRLTASLQNGKVQFYIFTAVMIVLLTWLLI